MDGDCALRLGRGSRLMAGREEHNGTVAACIGIRCERFPGYEWRRNVANVLKTRQLTARATRWRLRLLVGLAQSLRATFPDCQILRPSRTVAATGNRSARFWRQHDGDCGLWSGQVSDFVPMLRTHHTMGVLGQSPLPETDPHDFGGSTMATAVYGRGKSAASCQCSGRITRWAYWDSRRYRKKIRTICREARWRLRFMVVVSQRAKDAIYFQSQPV